MTSSDKELKMITTELSHLSLKRQQLLERKKILSIFQELRRRAEFGQTEEAASNQIEIDSIDDKLKLLTEKKAELQRSRDIIVSGNDKMKTGKEVQATNSEKHGPDDAASERNIFYIVAPPVDPAPKVILDMDKLPACPCRTQCPECRQFVETETFTSISSVTWLVCVMTAMIGCVAGCCLIPFCLDSFKSTTHRCPKCRTSITTVKKL